MKKTLWTVVVLAAIAASAQVVDQGMPGNQGPWPVILSGGSASSDGGTIGGATYPAQCRATAQDGGATEQNTVVGAATVRVPSTGAAPGTTTAAAGRIYMVVCNSAQNASTAVVKCRQDGTAPVFAAGNAGQVLLYGDCMTTTAPTTADAVQCIADAAARNVTSYECVP